MGLPTRCIAGAVFLQRFGKTKDPLLFIRRLVLISISQIYEVRNVPPVKLSLKMLGLGFNV